MPKILPFELTSKFSNYEEYNAYAVFQHPISYPKSELVACTICKRTVNHKMRVKYGFCAYKNCLEEEVQCPFRTKLCICLKHRDRNLHKHYLYSLENLT
ncbi:unnamed protein product [Brachionus calyciflorus]|uniref:Uncharacterized protein n=1 Tax=Brachionus calyciflorus TaxID=104777 RepID=A0A813U2J4_9BILA|nr:unnamed protein product [Brachionus calyciflorus]